MINHFPQVGQFDPYKQQVFTPRQINSYSPFLFSSIFVQYSNLLHSIKEYAKRIWSILSLKIPLVANIMACFQKTIVQSPEVNKKKTKNRVPFNPPISKNDQAKQQERSAKLKTLFQQPMNYEKFHDNILNHYTLEEDPVTKEKRPTTNLLYNIYDINSYLRLKNRKLNIFNRFQTDAEKDLKAGIATYDAIVDLYVRRFLKKNPDMNHESFLPSLRVMALALALKQADDYAIWISDLHPFIDSSVSVSTLTTMEVEFLKEINWDISLSEICIN